MKNLANDPAYAEVLAKMKGFYAAWNAENHDHGIDPIIWENCPPPKSVEIMEWIHEERPDIIDKMKKGIEPNYGKIQKEFQAAKAK